MKVAVCCVCYCKIDTYERVQDILIQNPVLGSFCFGTVDLS